MESFSIGAVVKMTGISADTIRTWERRYGRPKAFRNEVGHRRYDLDTCELLVLVQKLISRGSRPSEVLHLSRQELEARLDPVALLGAPTVPEISAPERAAEYAASLLLKVEQLDGAQVDKGLNLAWKALGPAMSLEHLVIPLIRDIGERWEHGRLGVHHEHLFSARLRQFLGNQWQALADHNHGPLIAMATPVREEHELGLQLAAMYFAMEGCRVLFLGPCTPAPVLLDAARQAQADALALSLSSSCERAAVREYLSQLLREYDKSRILVGGFGARHVERDSLRLHGRASVREWVQNRSHGATG